MPRRRYSGRPRGFAFFAAAAIAACGAAIVLMCCAAPRDYYVVGNPSEKSELRELFGLLDDVRSGSDPVQRFAALRQISTILIAQREYGRLAALLIGVAGETGTVSVPGTGSRDSRRGETGIAGGDGSSDPYAAWYLFTAAYAYELQGAAPIAALYYARIVKNWSDLIVDGRSVHYECLSRLIETVTAPERRIEFYRDLIARFPDRVDMGRVLFLLGKEYERVGDWDLAVRTYAKFLPYFATSIPGYPDAFQYAKNVIDFYNSPKDWAFEDLQVLVSNIRSALAAGDPYKLRRYRAKVNFFAVSWHQDEMEVNSQVLFDFSEFMAGGRISAAEELDSGSGPREAFLKTWGWSERIATWYLFFRKIYFPADPEIHGRWEWAGVYFGEKMQ